MYSRSLTSPGVPLARPLELIRRELLDVREVAGGVDPIAAQRRLSGQRDAGQRPGSARVAHRRSRAHDGRVRVDLTAGARYRAVPDRASTGSAPGPRRCASTRDECRQHADVAAAAFFARHRDEQAERTPATSGDGRDDAGRGGGQRERPGRPEPGETAVQPCECGRAQDFSGPASGDGRVVPRHDDLSRGPADDGERDVLGSALASRAANETTAERSASGAEPNRRWRLRPTSRTPRSTRSSCRDPAKSTVVPLRYTARRSNPTPASSCHSAAAGGRQRRRDRR